MSIVDKIKDAGVVGAGGGGFPAHLKAFARVDTVIANGAECEPLIHKDYELMLNFPDLIIRGLKIMMQATGAKDGIIGIKKKNQLAITTLSEKLDSSKIRIQVLGDFYPSGDEYLLVYEATKKLIPPQGIPIDVGVVVINVETLYNIARAEEGIPVTEKFITVAGAVKKPGSFFVPLGTSYKDAIDFAGGPAAGCFGVFVGGILMGKLDFKLDLPITKTTAGLIVLPSTHSLIGRMERTDKSMDRIGKSACDQCSYCTELCPRYILGYDIQPHKVMRSLVFTKTGGELWNRYAYLCCACGLCTLYACPEYLYPREVCIRVKKDYKAKSDPVSFRKEVLPHNMYESRRTPISQLIQRLGVSDYDVPSKMSKNGLNVKRLEIPLAQHIGAPAVPIVKTGDVVKSGQCIGEIPEGKTSARVHSGLDGKVAKVGESIIIEKSA